MPKLLRARNAQRTPDGYLGGPPSSEPEPTVTLASGQSASALLEGVSGAVPSMGTCTSYSNLLVTPPNETQSVTVPGKGYPLCYPEIHPVVSGTTGDATTPVPD